MIEKGKTCTIWPDSQVKYTITDVKLKKVKIVLDNITTEIEQYFVDLKQIENSSLINNVPISNINLTND